MVHYEQKHQYFEQNHLYFEHYLSCFEQNSRYFEHFCVGFDHYSRVKPLILLESNSKIQLLDLHKKLLIIQLSIILERNTGNFKTSNYKRLLLGKMRVYWSPRSCLFHFLSSEFWVKTVNKIEEFLFY